MQSVFLVYRGQFKSKPPFQGHFWKLEIKTFHLAPRFNGFYSLLMKILAPKQMEKRKVLWRSLYFKVKIFKMRFLNNGPTKSFGIKVFELIRMSIFRKYKSPSCPFFQKFLMLWGRCAYRTQLTNSWWYEITRQILNFYYNTLLNILCILKKEPLSKSFPKRDEWK